MKRNLMVVLELNTNHTDKIYFWDSSNLKLTNIIIFIVTIFLQNMGKLKCNDYGFECDFSVEGEIEKVIEDFRNHTEEIHGIDYSKEAVMQFLLRKQGL